MRTRDVSVCHLPWRFFWVVDSIAWVVSFLCAWMIFSSLFFLWMDERLSRGLILIPLWPASVGFSQKPWTLALMPLPYWTYSLTHWCRWSHVQALYCHRTCTSFAVSNVCVVVVTFVFVFYFCVLFIVLLDCFSFNCIVIRTNLERLAHQPRRPRWCKRWSITSDWAICLRDLVKQIHIIQSQNIPEKPCCCREFIAIPPSPYLFPRCKPSGSLIDVIRERIGVRL